MSRARDIEILREALDLERGAVSRYAEQSARTADPRLFSFWESLRRNECGHRDELSALLARFGATPLDDPAALDDSATLNGPAASQTAAPASPPDDKATT